jgi:hypothetical protein
LHASLWYPSSRVQTRPKQSDFSGQKNPQHAFLWRGSNAAGPMSQICSMLKIPTMTWKSPLSAKLLVISRPPFPLSLLEVSCVVVDMGAPGDASGNFKSRVSTISLQGCGTYPGHQPLGLYQKRYARKNTTPLEQNPNFLSSIITCHQAWIRHYDPQLKRQSSV